MTSRTPPSAADRGAPPSRRMVHIPALDGLRGVAILLVLVFHFSESHSAMSGWFQKLHRVAASGWVGVDLFFVLSGFLITSILFEAKRSDGYFRNFYMRRVLRIFPLYYGVLVVAFLLIPLVHPYQNPRYQNIAAHQGYLWAYLQNYVVWIDWKGFTHFWSLAVEEQFYLVWPTVVFFLNRRALMRLCGVLICVALAVRIGRVIHYRHLPPAEYQAIAQATYYYTFCRMDALLVGAFLALAAHGERGITGLARPAAVVGMMSGVLLAGLFVWNRGALLFPDPRVQMAGYTLLALFFGSLLVRAVVAGPGSLWGRFCNHTGLRFFGKYSYGIYVFHGFFALPLTDATYRTAVARYLGPVWLAVPAQVLVGTVLSVACALVSWHLFEKHFLKLKRFFEYRATTLGEPVRDTVVPPAAEKLGTSPMVGSVEVVPSLVDATGSASPARRAI